MKKSILMIAAIGLFAVGAVYAGTQVETHDTQEEGRWCYLVWCDNY